MNLKALLNPPTAREMALKEKQEAERLLLQAQTAKEFATQMEVYHAGRVKRLTEYLGILPEPERCPQGAYDC